MNSHTFSDMQEADEPFTRRHSQQVQIQSSNDTDPSPFYNYGETISELGFEVITSALHWISATSISEPTVSRTFYNSITISCQHGKLLTV